MPSFAHRVGFVFIFFLAISCCPVQKSEKIPSRESLAPEAASGLQAKTLAFAKKFMVAAAHPLAVEAGIEILKKGGNAVDAAIAIQMALNVVEPQSSGIGGGGFLLYYDAKTRSVTAYDGRETAPRLIRPDQFLDAKGEPRDFYDALVGGHAVGVPGVLAMLKTAHDDFGKTPWAALFQGAVRLAENGFPVSKRLSGLIATTPNLNLFPATRELFFKSDGKTAKPAGAILKNPELARTMRLLAERGIEPFYRGEIAREIVAAIEGAPRNPGRMTLEDLSSYAALKREPVCLHYRTREVCGMGPPSSGGVAVLQILGLLENFDLSGMTPDSEGFAHLFTQASRLAFADRDAYAADPAFLDVPVGPMLDGTYLKNRAGLIREDADMGTAVAGRFDGTAAFAPGRVPELTGTSHVSVVDGNGNAVSFTTSVENAFGSTLLVRGFLLNNTLTDFSFTAKADDGRPVANRIEPGKRPRSSMSPVLVFNAATKRLELAAGSPGGARIIDYVAQGLANVLDFGDDPQTAGTRPHVVNRNGVTELEKGTPAERLAAGLRARGHEVAVSDLNSGWHAVAVTPAGLLGAADPRRDGTAKGE